MAVKKKAPAKKVAAKKVAKKVVAKKAAPKKVVAKKVAKPAVKKAAPKKAAVSSVDKAYTKSQMTAYLAEQADISKKQAVSFFNALTGLVGAHLKSAKAGVFTLPGLLKCTVIKKPATPARKGINPFTGEPTTFKAKPARKVVKVRALKALKDMVK